MAPALDPQVWATDVVTAIVAMETADARLATIDDPAVTEVRRLLARELADALRG